jgi:hypothetical protein
MVSEGTAIAPKVKEIDFATLTADGLWSTFVSKTCYGGALAYAVLSRASKMGCLASASLEKLKENRMKQRGCWIEWCSLSCNLLWARRFSFQLVSERASYKNKILATWSESETLPLPSPTCSEFIIPADCVARIASLAVQSDSANLLEQILFCANDDRRITISELWLKIKNDFVCNTLWEPLFEFTFSEVRHIHPTVHHNDQLSLATIADTWLRIMHHLRKLFSSPLLLQLSPSDHHTVWVHCICSPSFEIPMSERAVIMWIWLLWSSHTLPFFINANLRSAVGDLPHSSTPPVEAENRLHVLTSLRAKRLITLSEYKMKRLCILGSL